MRHKHTESDKVIWTSRLSAFGDVKNLHYIGAAVKDVDFKIYERNLKQGCSAAADVVFHTQSAKA